MNSIERMSSRNFLPDLLSHEGYADKTLLPQGRGPAVDDIAPFEAALLILGNPPRLLGSRGFPKERLGRLQSQIEARPDFFSDTAEFPDDPVQGGLFSDSFSQNCLPVTQSGKTKALLYLFTPGEQITPQLSRKPSIPADDPFPAKPKVPAADSTVAAQLLEKIAHDMRTPLTVVRGYIKMMLDGRNGPLADSQRECLVTALESAERLVELASSVEHAAGSTAEFRFERVDIRDVWRWVYRRVNPQALAQSKVIRERVATDRLFILADTGRLATFLEDLVSYVLSIAEEGCPLQIELSRRSDDVAVNLSFSTAASVSQPLTSMPERLKQVVFQHAGRFSFTAKTKGFAVLTVAFPGLRL